MGLSISLFRWFERVQPTPAHTRDRNASVLKSPNEDRLPHRHGLPTCSWTIRALMAAYGFQDVHFTLFLGTKAFCSHQVSLVWIFESSLSSHYPPLMRSCSRASGFVFRRARLWCWCCCELLKFLEPTVLVALLSNFFVTLPLFIDG